MTGEVKGAGAEAPEGVPSLVKYCFIVDWTLFAEQQAAEGEEILRSEDPEAPEGMAFAGWFLEDGTQLFIDADGDGIVDPVVAHVDPLAPEVNVFARFVEAEPAEEGEGNGDDGEIGDEEAQKPSPSGEGAPAGAEEVSPDTDDTDETNDEGTSSVSPDGEPASPEGKPFGDPADTLAPADTADAPEASL